MKPVKYKKIEAKYTYRAYHWQHKGKPYVKALEKMGWVHSRIPDIFLVDHDLNQKDPSKVRLIVQKIHDMKTMCVIYPHSVLPDWWYGLEYKPSPLVSVRIQIAQAQYDAMKMLYPHLPLEIGGWPYSDIKPFKPCTPQKILFAAIHPPKLVDLRIEAQQANREILEALDKLKNRYQIRIRYIKELDRQNLELREGIEFKKGVPDGSTDDIEWADVVIADQTFLFIAAALGKPTIGILQTICPRGNSLEYPRPDTWKKWWYLVRHPLSHNEGNLKDLIEQAARYEPEEWKKNNIGNKLEPELIHDIMKRYLKTFKRQRS